MYVNPLPDGTRERVDCAQDPETGKVFIARVSGKSGVAIHTAGSFSHKSIAENLQEIGEIVELTDNTVEFAGTTWTEVAKSTVKPKAPRVPKPVVAPIDELPEEPTVAEQLGVAGNPIVTTNTNAPYVDPMATAYDTENNETPAADLAQAVAEDEGATELPEENLD
jgi:hypothetical protein